MNDLLHDDAVMASIRTLIGIAQTGLTYSKDPYDIERYQQLLETTQQLLAQQPSVLTTQLLHNLVADTGYATPKMDIRAAVFDGERILLVKEIEDGRWSLPGGWADINHSPAQVAAKEVLEESGLRVRPRKLVAFTDRRLHPHPPMLLHVYKAFFLCDLLDGTLRPSLETPEARFFDEHDLPELSTARVTHEQIAMMYRHLRNDALPTYFD
ncbi:NUDIX hydrolase N-terminal domain-containing protein [Pseudomonas soli]|uniref:NUDIX hydrolase n=1 Tax=Pseudomonas soli TaxID=1306993 RepID=A0AAJ5MJT5_9PSED|nr:NUDIX hydrolase N-terminal domain-containing protein [Pseudomonas soli]MDW9404525.1 NUDIX domain-containing protein [Pseudomonas soli]PYC41761.1 ADP-ribose pyrophosphatase [Pseudomonas soli]UXZ43982.1 NUDIX hydrolase [Pseudomonas soli]